ncbi:type III secretion system outer membrane ring subunit SctC [Paraburkholderia humisilvae]|uniref:Type 3 secretion system secretin n=1 Tax=Paraburkholderia humisilvae TaxID=627669 RepID=A0A6J5F843_9BURK|nr:type III secretion system outer membrane ring subunit SctC [Paraburkholderia humisilvae]CAB3773306.1 Type 3 secretion system secretin [Paraburkholderia humisilvae]
MKLMRAALFAALIYGGMIQVLDAAPVKWSGQSVHILVQGKDLKDVLRDFTASQGVTAQISPNVQGTVTGQFDMPPQRFFDTLAATFGFVWFYDGSVLTIASPNELTRQVVTLRYATTSQLEATLSKMGLTNNRYPLNSSADAHAAVVTGPPQYVQLVSDVARQLDQSVASQTSSVMRIFKLSHAWAADHSVQIDGKAVTVPGVATVLSKLFQQKGQSDAPSVAGVVASGGRRLKQLTDVGGNSNGGTYPPLPQNPGSQGGILGSLFNGKPPLPPGNADMGFGKDSGDPLSGGDGDAVAGDTGLPIIEADPATNSILIRDTPQHMDQYEPVIEELDKRRKVIEIEAQIIEIDDNALKQLGVDWRAHNSHVDFQTGTGTTQANGYNGFLDPSFGTTQLAGSFVANATPVGASISAVLGDAGRYLLARIDALQQSSEAKIEATPKVATLDNVEAVMANKTSFYVRVSGYASADLYNVVFGTSLRVLPMVVQENGKTMIKLNVHIEDGNFATGQEVDTIPIVTTTEINTQAYVGENQSLLIGGYSVNNRKKSVTGIPGLSEIPIIGELFRYHDDTNSHMERLFLITPRIISL